jgi:hypothetical protein
MLFVRGDGVILVRMFFSVALSVSALLSILGIASFSGVTFVRRFMALGVIRFCTAFCPHECEAWHAHHSWIVVRALCFEYLIQLWKKTARN